MYVVNALYLWPITLWTYIQYGRPPKPVRKGDDIHPEAAHHPVHAQGGEEARQEHDHHDSRDEHGHHNHPHGDSSRPMFATVTVAVCHCGAGCVIGDIIGEWLVYGTNATINGRTLWPEYLIGKRLFVHLHPSRTSFRLTCQRFCVCDSTRHLLSVLFYRSDGRSIWIKNLVPRCKSRLSVVTLLRNRAVWVDGYLSSCHFSLETRNDYYNILVDDAGLSSNLICDL